jgi:hypothetical protein
LPEKVAKLRVFHERRARSPEARVDRRLGQAEAKRAEPVRQLRQELVQAKRREMIDIHKREDISDSALRACTPRGSSEAEVCR